MSRQAWVKRKARLYNTCECEKRITPGDYYWNYKQGKSYCLDCGRKKMNKTTPEEMAKRVLYVCMTENVDPHQLLLALQNKMDLS